MRRTNWRRPEEPTVDAAGASADLVARHVETIATVRARAGRQAGRHQRAIERLTLLIGRPVSLYLLLILAVAWIALNVVLAHTSGGALDPAPFFWLQGVLGLAALVTAMTVLTTQTRHARHAEERAQLDLHVNLVAEQKTAKIISLLEELRRDLPNVLDRQDPIARAMSEAVNPREVMSALQETFEEDTTDPALRKRAARSAKAATASDGSAASTTAPLAEPADERKRE